MERQDRRAPWNGSFQASVTALRLIKGEDLARDWPEGMKDSDARDYPNNVSIVQATANGEVEVGFVNHDYLERFLADHGPGFKARNYYIGNGETGKRGPGRPGAGGRNWDPGGFGPPATAQFIHH